MVKHFNSVANLSTNLSFPTLPPSLFTMNRFLSDWLVTWGFLQATLGTCQIFWNLTLKTKQKKSLKNGILYSVYQLGKILACWSTYRILSSDLTIITFNQKLPVWFLFLVLQGTTYASITPLRYRINGAVRSSSFLNYYSLLSKGDKNISIVISSRYFRSVPFPPVSKMLVTDVL